MPKNIVSFFFRVARMVGGDGGIDWVRDDMTIMRT